MTLASNGANSLVATNPASAVNSIQASGAATAVAPQISAQGSDANIAIQLAAKGTGAVQLLTDGREIYARTARGEFYNLLKAPTQPMLVVGNEGFLKELGGKVRARKRSKSSAAL